MSGIVRGVEENPSPTVLPSESIHVNTVLADALALTSSAVAASPVARSYFIAGCLLLFLSNQLSPLEARVRVPLEHVGSVGENGLGLDFPDSFNK